MEILEKVIVTRMESVSSQNMFQFFSLASSLAIIAAESSTNKAELGFREQVKKLTKEIINKFCNENINS